MHAMGDLKAAGLTSTAAFEGGLEDGASLTVFVSGEAIARQVIYCRSAGLRRQGLLGRRRLTPDQGALLVMPDSRRERLGLPTSIHMLGMGFPLAVAWLDAGARIVYAGLARPWRPYYASPEPASFVLELHPGHMAKLLVGAQVAWEETFI
jgi:uncharacterized membrane protein (UPF0127 family)